MDTLSRVQVFLASPGDLAEERVVFVRVVEEINRTVATPGGIYLECVRWETHARPGMGEDAQAVINSQIGPRDLFVGLMWTRFGTPTSRAQSGTHEEFERAYESWRHTGRPKIMFYFKTKPFYPRTAEEIEQMKKVVAFRDEVASRGALLGEFAEVSDFADGIRQHLTMEVQAMIRARSGERTALRAAHGDLQIPPGETARDSHDSSYESPSAVAVRPTLTFVYRRDGWYLQNKGRGAALDILVAQKHVKGTNAGKWFDPVRVPTLAPGEEARLPWLGHENDTGLGAAYRDEDERPFTAVTGNDLTKIFREWALPAFTESEIRRHWQVEGFGQPHTGRREDSPPQVPSGYEPAAGGDPDAMFRLGNAYLEGTGILQNVGEGIRWIRKSAEAGHPAAMRLLGLQYAKGSGLEKSEVDAFRWWRDAAKAGDAKAMLYLGRAYYFGTGVPQSDSMAFEWLRKAGVAGEMEAAVFIGHMYLEGRGVPQSNEEARRWMQLAADAGVPLAMRNLGVMYKLGRGVTQNDAEAFRWFKKAADAGDPQAIHDVATCYQQGTGVSKNDQDAFRWHEKAAVAGDIPAMTCLGFAFRDGTGVEKNLSEALRWFEKAAEAGDARGMYVLGRMYQDGQGVEKSDVRAAQLFEGSAAAGYRDAMIRLSGLYRDGRGVPRDADKATSLLDRAEKLKEK